MVYSGKIYETDGAQAVGVHEAEAVRPLAPVGHANSVRIFDTSLFRDDEPAFAYGNPAALLGPSQLIPYPGGTGELGFDAYLAAVVVVPGSMLDLAQADDIILGLTIMTVLVARDVERRQGFYGGRARDLAATIGPVMTTPDELDEAIVDSENGRRYALSVVVRVNGVETYRGNIEDLETSLAQAVSQASQSCRLATGDVIALGPIAETADVRLDVNDEIQVSVERLGMLATKIADEIHE